MVLRWKSDLSAAAACGETTVNTLVLVSFHFFRRIRIGEVLGRLLGVILGGFGDLWGQFCDFGEVRRTSEILRWIWEAKVNKNKTSSKIHIFLYKRIWPISQYSIDAGAIQLAKCLF